MNIERLRQLDTFDHLNAVEVEHYDGYRAWEPVRESEMAAYLAELDNMDGYGLSDIDHHAKCECLASWDEWMFLLDFQRLSR